MCHQVAVEATYGWYWAVDALSVARFEVRGSSGAPGREEGNAQTRAGQDRPA